MSDAKPRITYIAIGDPHPGLRHVEAAVVDGRIVALLYWDDESRLVTDGESLASLPGWTIVFVDHPFDDERFLGPSIWEGMSPDDLERAWKEAGEGAAEMILGVVDHA